jgi:hypothetical protein
MNEGDPGPGHSSMTLMLSGKLCPAAAPADGDRPCGLSTPFCAPPDAPPHVAAPSAELVRMMRGLAMLAMVGSASAWWKDQDTKTRGEVSAGGSVC